MNILFQKKRPLQSLSSFLGFTFAIILSYLALITSAHSGVITGVPAASPTATEGFDGWNLANVVVLITDADYVPYNPTLDPLLPLYNPLDGSYTAYVPKDPNDSFESLIYDGDPATGTVMGRLHGKDWPIGEPSGVKVLTDTLAGTELEMPNGKSDSCIMTTSFDPEALGFHLVHPETAVPTVCASAFQSHKRYKINLQPSTVDGIDVESVDMVFNVEGPDIDHRYQVFQKINNYTDSRLSGYTLEIGFGVGENFEPAANHAWASLWLDIGIGDRPKPDPDTGLYNIWAIDQLANFSHGLWGPALDPKYFPVDGFFSDIRTGYVVSLNADETIISSGITLDEQQGGNYEVLFGEWLPSIWQPSAILWDDDDNPATDDTLMAYWADVDGADGIDVAGIGVGDGNYAWTGGFPNFNKIPEATLKAWAANPIYYMGLIEDVLNLGLNYNVNVGSIRNFPDFTFDDETEQTGTATFTIRVTPIKAPLVTQVEPGWITNPPPEFGTNVAFLPAVVTYLLF